MKVWAIDPGARRLSDITEGGATRVFGGDEPYGACGYRSARTGRFCFFVTNDDGEIEQYELREAGDGRVTGRRVRSFEVGSVAEGCAADHELEVLYVAEETEGVWKSGAEPESDGKGTLVARVVRFRPMSRGARPGSVGVLDASGFLHPFSSSSSVRCARPHAVGLG